MAYVVYVVLVLVFLFFEAAVYVGAQQNVSNLIRLGSSLSPIVQPTSWKSPSGRFSFGFYQQGTGFLVGIWLVGNSETTVVWTANRDDPPMSSNATLNFTSTGKLVVREQSEAKPIANLTDSASSASMLDSGNFVLYDNDYKVIWESFRFPTDSILGGQTLLSGGHLLSRSSETSYSSTGQFLLAKQDDGNLVLYSSSTVLTPQDAYWATNSVGLGKCYLYLNYTGSLVLVNNTSHKTLRTLFPGSDSYVESTIYRATLNYDGLFQLYSHRFDSNGNYKSLVKWSVPSSTCLVKGYCGFNSYCTMNDNQPVCICLPGSILNHNHNSRGCERDIIVELCKDGKDNASFYNMTTMENMRWDDPPYYKALMSEQDCNRSCLEDCNCQVALFETGTCSKHNFPLRYARRENNYQSTAFFKVLKISPTINNTNVTTAIPVKPQVVVITSKKALTLIIVVTLGFITCSCVFLVIACFFIFKYRVVKYKRLLENGNLGFTDEITLRSFSYSELKKATNGFKEELGKGASGSVYKGTLNKGRKLVAVKRLEKVVNEGEREFRAETRAIGRTHHRNLVRLLGYCAEDSKRLLVYEYMSNGSLADLLFRSQRRPDWNERVRIALDVARGILYLHEECDTPTIHCDIKPQNILMDDFWTAKISDFGLAKLLMPDQTRTFTIVRGTRGYLAPEWQKNIPISVKADIYSFGMVLLEIVSCRRNMEFNASKPEEIVLSTWAYKCFVARELEKLVMGEEVDKMILENMVKVGLWCIQDEPALRPSMKSVVLMLEGITDIAIPPCPNSTSSM